MRWKIAIIMIIAAALGYQYLAKQPQAPTPAPSVVFHTLDGDQLALSDMQGATVLINFWATSCHWCVEDIPELIKLYEELHPKGLEMVNVAMSYDPPNRVLELSEAAKLPYDVALDLDDAVADAFGEVRLTPTSFLVDPQGQIVLHTLGALDFPALRAKITTYL